MHDRFRISSEFVITLYKSATNVHYPEIAMQIKGPSWTPQSNIGNL
jgi:hypothetical protein